MISHWQNQVSEVDKFIQFFQDEKNSFSDPGLSEHALHHEGFRKKMFLKAIEDLEEQQLEQYKKARKALDLYNPNPRLYGVNLAYCKKKRNKSLDYKAQEISLPSYSDFL